MLNIMFAAQVGSDSQAASLPATWPIGSLEPGLVCEVPVAVVVLLGPCGSGFPKPNANMVVI